jgi:predicted transcriptional regulator
MPNLTIRIEDELKKDAFHQAQKLGISLTLVIKNALKNFVKSGAVIIGEPEDVEVDDELQQKMDRVASILV